MVVLAVGLCQGWHMGFGGACAAELHQSCSQADAYSMHITSHVLSPCTFASTIQVPHIAYQCIVCHMPTAPHHPPPPQKLLTAGITASLLSTKDVGERESMRRQSLDLAELLDFVARSGMAAMLQGPVFDTDSRRPLGPVLQWVDTWVA